jgi:ABC-type glycerol-3-phosphate transport system substrate-binding protein
MTVYTSKLYNHLVSRRGFLEWAGRSAAFAGVLAATRALPAVAADAPTLRIWMGEDYVPAWNAYLPVMIKKIGAELGVNVEVELTPDNDTGRARRATALESDTLPDIMQSGTADAAQLYDLKKLNPITKELYDRMNAANPWLENIQSFVTARDGTIYAIPFFTRPWLMHYRKDIFDKKGIKVPVMTLDDLKAVAKEVNDPDNGLYGVGMPYGQADMDGHMVAFPWLYNSSWQDAHGNLTINTPANLEALKSYLSFYQDGLDPQDALNWGGVGNNNAYATGLAAIVNNTGSLFASLQKDHPDVAAATVLGPWPKAIPDGKPVETTIGFCLCIPHNSPNAELAAKFVEKMLDPANMGPLLEAGSGQAMPVRKNLSEIDYFKTDPIVSRIVEQVVPYTLPFTYPGPNNGAYGELTSNNSPYFKSMLHRVLVDGMSPEDSLKQFDADGAALSKKYG